MIEFVATIKKFDKQGEKTGWSYIEVPADLAQKLKKNNKRSFRVKGKLDSYPIKGIALLPMGGGSFIMALNAEMQKAIGKKKGAMVKAKLSEDKEQFILNSDLLACLEDEPRAKAFWLKLPPSHQRYYSKWVDSVKSEEIKVKRITMAVEGMARGLSFGEMLRFNKKT